MVASTQPATVAARRGPIVKGSVVHFYLICYNSLCLALWITSARHIAAAFAQNPWHPDVRPAQPYIKYAMCLALLEAVHAQLKLVKSSPVTTLMQVTSRLHVIFLIWNLLPKLSYTWATTAVVVAWTLAELIRYPFYIATLAMTTSVPRWLWWLRYSGFLVLYPLGISGEVWTMLRAVQEFRGFGLWPTAMPNALNFEMSLKTLYQIILLIYVPGSVHMYTHMLKQRAKALSKIDDKKL